MSDAETAPMHPDFPRWYATVTLGNDEARLSARWAGVIGVAQETGIALNETLVRLAFKAKRPAAAAESQKIREAFRAADPTFAMQGNDHELQILAAATLAALMQEGGDEGAAAALAVTTTALDGAHKPILPMDLGVLAEAAIAAITEAQRKRPILTADPAAPKVDFEKSMAKVRETPNAEGFAQAFQLCAETVRKALGTLAVRQSNALRGIDKFVRAQDEELQMLWWLISQRSVDLNCGFEDVAPDARPLVFGKELADCTQFLPGPASMLGLLSRAGLADRPKIAVTKAIMAADFQWLQQLAQDKEPSQVSCPLHFAIARQIETGTGDAWIAGWAAACDVPADLALSPLTLGYLFYCERLRLLFGDE